MTVVASCGAQSTFSSDSRSVDLHQQRVGVVVHTMSSVHVVANLVRFIVVAGVWGYSDESAMALCSHGQGADARCWRVRERVWCCLGK
ncbi:hypothetical protein DEO72_LG4g385 [Vigna unguiculata]|uniref:Uncharacterized protein n=1 Tax=Vigna unguiculata TaxID=3917 RepID=A0A4D6LLH4_VIGUN|nr:hypothetical protein DEO72_LG4g385 [Vigna unguiculata]